VSLSRLGVFTLLLIASVWVTFINGQPFFMPDTSAYIRGPDFAVVYFLGPRFSTAWTQGRTVHGGAAAEARAESQKPAFLPLNSPFDKAMLKGRSIYYGALLYAGHLTSYFWLCVVVQAVIFIYLSYTLVVTCLGLSLASFVWTTAVVLALTPLPLFIGFLMPDVFCGFLVLAIIILAGFWRLLILRDKVLVLAIAIFSVLGHASHLLLAISLTFVAIAIGFVSRNKQTVVGSLFQRALILLAILLAGFLGEQVFSYAARAAIGAEPMRLPFVTARLIDDGPGYRFLQKHCATHRYAVCQFMDRLPTNASSFLWSVDPKIGVFSASPLSARRAISDEQGSFAFDVFLSDPAGVLLSVARNFIGQLTKVGVPEFFPTQDQVRDFGGNLPASYSEQMARSPLVLNRWILGPLNWWFNFIYFTSTIILIVLAACWPFVNFLRKPEILPEPQWLYVLAIPAAAIFCNAAICGALSGVFWRYQTRISWLPLFILLIVGAKLWLAYDPGSQRQLVTEKIE
jgi:hypothetical protein